MPTFSKLFQDEIRRLARKEIKPELDRMKQENTEMRRALASLKKQVLSVEKASRARRPHPAHAEQPAEAGKQDRPAGRARITSHTVRTMRQRLGLTQADVGRLVGVSGQSVYQWERRDGRLQLRHATREAIAQAKGMGVREARAKLQQSD